MKKAIYGIFTKDGYPQSFTFTEHHSDDDYGNGNYISVVRGRSEILGYVDVRYMTYDFDTFCQDYIKSYFGENLLRYERVKE